MGQFAQKVSCVLCSDILWRWGSCICERQFVYWEVEVEQLQWREGAWREASGTPLESAHLVLLFGGRVLLTNTEARVSLLQRYPGAFLLGCSTAGEICGTSVTDEGLVATAVRFRSTTIVANFMNLASAEESYEAGLGLTQGLPKDGLRHVFVLSDGLNVNGSELTRGLRDGLPGGVTVTGGLAGDGAKFEQTLVVCSGKTNMCRVGAIGLYGRDLQIGYASLGGWDPFGPDRLITKSKANVLYELDGQSALALYKKYLGEHAAGLPATGLLFPLSLKSPDASERVVRTILGVDESLQSITFAGDVPEGVYANFMKANFDRLVDGAHGAAETSCGSISDRDPDLAILISCVGRKLVLKQRVEDEVDAVRQVVGQRCSLAGFYSYGEISPFTANARCELHNQTMTITTLKD